MALQLHRSNRTVRNNSALAEFLFVLIFFPSFEQARTRSRQTAKHTVTPGGISRCVVVVVAVLHRCTSPQLLLLNHTPCQATTWQHPHSTRSSKLPSNSTFNRQSPPRWPASRRRRHQHRPPPTVNVNAVAVKLPDFWPADPTTWFHQAEAAFRRSNVTVSYTKYDHVLMKLPTDVVMSVRDLVNSMQPNTADA